MEHGLLVILLLSLCVNWTLSKILKEAVLSLSDVTVAEGEGFLVSFAPDEGPWDVCNVTISGTKKAQEVYEPLNATETKSTAFGVLETFEPGDCGVRVHNVSLDAHDTKWSFIAIHGDHTRRKKLQLSVDLKDSFICPDKSKDICFWRNPLNPKDRQKCQDNEPAWKDAYCEMKRTGSMKLMEVKRPEKIDTSFQEFTPIQANKAGRSYLSCEAKKPVKSCSITQSLTGRTYNIEDGLQHGQYSAYLTQIHKRRCQFEMPKTIEKDDEGIWTIQMQLKDGTEHTCRFNLLRTEFMKNIDERTKEAVVIDTMDNQLTITCVENLPYAVRKCFLLSEVGPEFQFSNNATDLLNGHCRFSITVDTSRDLKLNDHHVNKFTCVFNREKPDEADFVQPLHVRLHTNPVINGKVGDQTLECHHIHKTPIDSCILVSPSKKPYSVPSEKYKGKDFEYHGPPNGFSQGACGAKFQSELEEGQWTCIIKEAGENSGVLKTSMGLIVGEGSY